MTLSVLGWVFVLRHRVKRQTRVIRNQLEQAAALKEAAEAANRAKSDLDRNDLVGAWLGLRIAAPGEAANPGDSESVGTGRGAERSGRGGKPRQERFPGQHEP